MSRTYLCPSQVKLNWKESELKEMPSAITWWFVQYLVAVQYVDGNCFISVSNNPVTGANIVVWGI